MFNLGVDTCTYNNAASFHVGQVGAPNPCTVNVTFSPTSGGAKSATINFAANNNVTVNLTGTGLETPYWLELGIDGSGTVTSDPAGISCPGACGAWFYDGQYISLTAHEDAGGGLESWGGHCYGVFRGGPCPFTITDHTRVTATFLDLSGGGGGDTLPHIPLTQPEDGSTLGGTGTTFGWGSGSGARNTDASTDGESYTITYCTNEALTEVCNSIEVAMATARTIVLSAFGGATGIGLIGFIMIGGLRSRTGRSLALMILLTGTVFIAACGSSSSSSSDPDAGTTTETVCPTGSTCQEVTGLLPDTTYWWKVTAYTNGVATGESEIWSFTTGS